MTDAAFYPGSQIKLRVVFKTTGGAEVDPTTLRLFYKEPNGTVTVKLTSQITKETTGTYYYLLVPTTSQMGDWQYGSDCTGTAIGADRSGRFKVIEANLTT